MTFQYTQTKRDMFPVTIYPPTQVYQTPGVSHYPVDNTYVQEHVMQQKYVLNPVGVMNHYPGVTGAIKAGGMPYIVNPVITRVGEPTNEIESLAQLRRLQGRQKGNPFRPQWNQNWETHTY
jgi:hypothetical protein